MVAHIIEKHQRRNPTLMLYDLKKKCKPTHRPRSQEVLLYQHWETHGQSDLQV